MMLKPLNATLRIKNIHNCAKQHWVSPNIYITKCQNIKADIVAIKNGSVGSDMYYVLLVHMRLTKCTSIQDNNKFILRVVCYTSTYKCWNKIKAINKAIKVFGQQEIALYCCCKHIQGIAVGCTVG